MSDTGVLGRFSLIHVLAALAIVAVVGVATAPLVVDYVRDARRSRALSGARAIGQAIVAFHLDTGRWPVSDDGNLDDSGELSRLVGLSAADISSGNIPAGGGVSTGDENWDGGGSGGNAGALEDFLTFNSDADTDPLYPASADPATTPGWNGPYLKAVPLDPWGQPFVVNVRYLDGAGVNGATTAEEKDHAVFVLSAGPNGVFETSFDDATSLEDVGGDDIGYMIEGRVTR